MKKSDSTIVEYTPQHHGFYEELVRLVICLGSVGKAIELHAIGAVRKYKTADTIVIEGKQHVSGLEVHFFPRPFYDRLLSPVGKQAEFVRVIKRAINRHLPSIQSTCPTFRC